MGGKLIQEVANKLRKNYHHLIIVRNIDGFLAEDDVCQQLLQEYNIEVIKGSRLELRIHYELEYKSHPERTYVYLVDNVKSVLPDMCQECVSMDFGISSLFPLFENKRLLREQQLEVLEKLYECHAIEPINLKQGEWIIKSIKHEIENEKKNSIANLLSKLNEIKIDWNNWKETIEGVSTIHEQAIEVGTNDAFEKKISYINNEFQKWIEQSYFALLRNMSLLWPQSVNKILPYITTAHKNEEKVALFVVDGFTYWQYVVLRDYLEKNGISVQNGATLSWLPSITKLARQAIFRGGDPKIEYRQSPENERKLWEEYWIKQHFSNSEILYIYGCDDISIGENVKRLAIVTADMDEKMHASSEYKELWLLTNNWCGNIVKTIKMILEKGFTMYLTTDHGSTFSIGWRQLNTPERAFVYKDGSRGARHLIYDEEQYAINFKKSHPELDLLLHNNWLCMRDDKCFAHKSKKMITHGGSHFMEVVIPFVKMTI